MKLQACLVLLGGEQFAVDVRSVREVMVIERLTAMPGAPSFVLGVASLRGEVLAMIDVAPALGLPPCHIGPRARALVIEPPTSQVAIATDQVLGLERFDDFRRNDDTVNEKAAAFGVGWLERDGGLVTLLDVPKVLNALRLEARGAAGVRERASLKGSETR
jgi:purine-binding chemotaxis protein CheW